MSEPAKTNEGIFTLSKPVIMSFPQLFEPKAFTENGKPKGEPKYSANLTFDADSADLKTLKTLAAGLARAKWPDAPFFLTTQEGVKLPQILFPFGDGTKAADKRKAQGKEDGEWQRGKWIISARSKYEPKLSIIENGRIVELETEAMKQLHKGKFYSGVEVLAQLNLVPYDAVGQGGKPGVTAYLNMVCSIGKGAKLTGGVSASEAFRGYVGSVSSENPMGPGVDENLDDIMGL